MANNRKPVNPAAQNSLDQMKYEISNELGIADKVRSEGWASMTSADCGRVGGYMTRKMIEQYEASLAGGQTAAPANSMTAKYDVNKMP